VLATLAGLISGATEYLSLPHPDLTPPLIAFVYRIAIVGAASTCRGPSKGRPADILAALALAVLALLAGLPGYTVDFHLELPSRCL
jgi:cation:H+ antiporter